MYNSNNPVSAMRASGKQELQSAQQLDENFLDPE